MPEEQYGWRNHQMNDKKIIDYTKAGVRIGDKRRKMGLRQAEVNEMINLNNKYLSQVESGKTIPSIDALMRICAALHTTPNHILLGTVRNDSDDKLIREKTKLIMGKKKNDLLSNFIDWLAEQDD